jgi:hypothetical protein
MLIKSCVAVSLVIAAVVCAPPSARAQADYQQVLSTLGKQGDFKDNVLKVNIPGEQAPRTSSRAGSRLR